jgi:predicted MPP superfamily phosphohydrolase
MSNPSQLSATGPRQRLLIVLGVLAAIIAAIIWHDTDFPRLREVTIPVPGLAHQVDVLQVTDLGSAEFGRKQSKLAALIAGKRYDAIVLTGDMLNDRNAYAPIWDLVNVVKQHSTSVWYLPGNHDHPPVGAGMALRGVPSLPTTGAVPLAAWDPNAQSAALVYGRDTPSISAAKGKSRELVLIASHTPPSQTRLAAGLALGSGVHLFIAGHTHGGQVRLPFIGAIVAPMSWPGEERLPAVGNEATFFPDLQGRFVDGMYVRSGQRIFVAQGLDCNTTGIRFGSQAEIVAYHFVPAAAP